MRAAQFHIDSGTVNLGDIPIPEPEGDEIVVRTISSGPCHTDLMVLDGSTPNIPKDIVIIAHEGVCEIVTIGNQDVFNESDINGLIKAFYAY
ncbi:uncharacterized protein A1O9_06025 [Exophiala aquamarina CBS 119918]|uniref:Uncharacterized protein n=1 Tax=Exophiala aquamarina CBS 119918 TaxID=1182545 RepID=A0A072PEA2_9EURO|nr:uncharacterized protein A1O9_06025 [Exophiala aquamarina CBS 119918]KEF58102.1 hypothetical protein A1O9_06025 [Exophiala aquamarina CBS 119918]